MVSVRVLVTAVLPFKKNHSFSIRSKMLFFAPILLFFAMFWGPTSAHANDIYFAQNAAGAVTGYWGSEINNGADSGGYPYAE